MKEKRFHVVVEGSGSFPIDMLRYDKCWPSTESDSITITDEGLRSVTLTYSGIVPQPTNGRWNSFGWMVRQITAF
jgi:hypothetical protein